MITIASKKLIIFSILPSFLSSTHAKSPFGMEFSLSTNFGVS